MATAKVFATTVGTNQHKNSTTFCKKKKAKQKQKKGGGGLINKREIGGDHKKMGGLGL